MEHLEKTLDRAQQEEYRANIARTGAKSDQEKALAFLYTVMGCPTVGYFACNEQLQTVDR